MDLSTHFAALADQARKGMVPARDLFPDGTVPRGTPFVRIDNGQVHAYPEGVPFQLVLALNSGTVYVPAEGAPADGAFGPRTVRALQDHIAGKQHDSLEIRGARAAALAKASELYGPECHAERLAAAAWIFDGTLHAGEAMRTAYGAQDSQIDLAHRRDKSDRSGRMIEVTGA